MHLNDALTDIANRYNLDAQTLIEFAELDTIGGWDGDEKLHGWPCGSLWGVEGQVLYALVRALKPLLCVEFGTWYGCSATHIASALHANGRGKLICVDNGGFGDVRIPPHLLDYVEFKSSDLFNYIHSGLPAQVRFDFIFEDAMHSESQVYAVWDSALNDGLLAPGGMIISHDAMHRIVGGDVQRGISNAGATGVASYLIEPSDCGLAVWRSEVNMKAAFDGTPEEFLDALDEDLEPGEQLIIEKPKRKPRTKKAAAK